MEEDERTDPLIDAIAGLGEEDDGPFADVMLEGLRRRLGLTEAPLMIDRFVLGEPLGAGGMGVVYAADDPRLERRVALKLLHTRGLEGAERGLREARALARLSHPNVVTVYEAGIHEGRVFVVMELVQGQTLGQWLRTARSWREVCTVMLAAGRGLAAAHAVGITHRDFKPDNVLVAERVRVADFGLAQTLDEDHDTGEPAGTSLESGGEPTGRRRPGTLAFMAPEQLRGAAIDARTDQFAFCATLCLALSGQPPFRGDTPEQRLAAIERGPTPASLAGMPRWLRPSIERGLRASPADRHPRLDELLDALERHLRPRRWLGAGLATTAVIGAGVAWWSAHVRESECREAADAIDAAWNPARRDALAAAFAATGKPYAAHALAFVESSLDRYAAGWVDARVEACRAQQTGRTSSLASTCLERRLEELDALVAQLEPADAEVVKRANQVVSALPPPSECAHPDALDDVSTVDPETRGRLASARGMLARSWAVGQVGRYAEARDAVESWIPELRTLGHEATLAQALLQRGRLEIRLGELEAAHRSLWEALQLGLVARGDRIVAFAAAELCEELTARGELVRAHEAAELAATMHQRLTGERSWPLLVNLEGGLLMQEHRNAEAIEVLAAGIAACDENDPDDFANLTSMYGNQAAALLRVGRLDEAEAAIDRSQAILRRLYGEAHPMYAISMIASAAIQDGRGNTEEALAEQREGLEIWQRAVPEPTPVTASMIYNTGLFLMTLGRHEEALVALREALALWERLLPPGHTRLGHAHTGIGRTLREMGALAQALEHHEQALAILEREVRQAEPLAGDPLLQAAKTALRAEQRERADAWIEQGLRIYAATPNPVMVGSLRFLRAQSLQQQGQPERADEEARAALALLRGADERGTREIEAWLVAREQ